MPMAFSTLDVSVTILFNQHIVRSRIKVSVFSGIEHPGPSALNSTRYTDLIAGAKLKASDRNY